MRQKESLSVFCFVYLREIPLKYSKKDIKITLSYESL